VNFALFCGYKNSVERPEARKDLPRRGAKKSEKRKVEEITAGCWEWECRKKLKRPKV
jgi:hypothetical protein